MTFYLDYVAPSVHCRTAVQFTSCAFHAQAKETMIFRGGSAHYALWRDSGQSHGKNNEAEGNGGVGVFDSAPI